MLHFYTHTLTVTSERPCVLHLLAAAGFLVFRPLLLHSTSKLGSIKRRGNWFPRKDGCSVNSSTRPGVKTPCWVEGVLEWTLFLVRLPWTNAVCDIRSKRRLPVYFFCALAASSSGPLRAKAGQTLLIRSGFMCKQRQSYYFWQIGTRETWSARWRGSASAWTFFLSLAFAGLGKLLVSEDVWNIYWCIFSEA